MKQLIVLALVFGLNGCASKQQPNVPDAELVTVSREEPDEDCQEIGGVTGTVSSAKGTPEQALEDLKRDASRRGANYVHLRGHSVTGTMASGTAYQCP